MAGKRPYQGKVVGGSRYIYKDAINLLDSPTLDRVEEALCIVSDEIEWNVVKLDLKDANKLSLLDYENFEEYSFPALKKSYLIDLSKKSFNVRRYSNSNPPILHRKELLIDPKSPNIELFRDLTDNLERMGAFSNITRIGSKVYWKNQLDEIGIEVKNHKIFPIKIIKDKSKQIARHKTAISRSSLSLPSKILFTSGIANSDRSFLDYGCGRGDDLKYLSELGIKARGWDPHFVPDEGNLEHSDVVNLGFVLNVIEDIKERVEVLKRAFSLTHQCLCVSVMLHSQDTTINSIPFNDGHITSIRTFQKFYDQKEIENFISSTLSVTGIAAAPGIFLIFKEETAEQEFLLKRQLGLVRDYEPRDSVIKEQEYKNAEKSKLNLAKNLAKHTLIFARKPGFDELPRYVQDQIQKSNVKFNKAFDAAIKLISQEDLVKAAETKKEQLSLFFAMHLFSGRPKYRGLSNTLQKDIKLHFGSMSKLEENAKILLFSLGKEDLIFRGALDAEKENLGFLDDTKFNFLPAKLQKLPVRLRGILTIAERISGTIEDIDLIRIHIDTKKITYLTIPEIHHSALPPITQRTVVDLRDQSVKLFSHSGSETKKVLYLKSRLLKPGDDTYQIQKEFDENVLNQFDLDFSGEGPKFEIFSKLLAEKNIKIPKFNSDKIC